MISPKAGEAAGDKFALHPVCAGPYKFVERVAQDRIVVEKFADFPPLGRFAIRDMGQTVAAGVVLDVVPKVMA